MNTQDDKYASFGLVQDMLAVPNIIRDFDPDRLDLAATAIAGVGRLLMTGEGSSRLFPAKHAIAIARREGWPLALHTEAGQQSQDYDLADWAVFALSNSGRTAEVIELFSQLADAGHSHRYSLTAFADSKLESLATQGYVLNCGQESAVAATKSVIEQALCYHALLEAAASQKTLAGSKDDLASQVNDALTTKVPEEIVDKIASAQTIYWAGRNDGVAEELTLKTNEITRKPSDFLEGTYAVHGVEEVMQADDVVIWIDPPAGSESKFEEVLGRGVGLTIVTISSRDTRFPTLRIPDGGALSGYVQMAAGWNILVDVGLKLGVDLDKPERARKVGNEFTE